ncbi:MAG: tryptophan 7-halogenase [Gammaproteobacteria bacterium]|nr:tryptophan 7-halogenase [Gammaproteobacteria bacterium]
MLEQQCDVLVIGGGPAGSTVSTLLAEKGWSVTMLEKSHHPRFHIGESLLPMNLPILDRLGVLAQVDEIGIKKYAAEFNSLNHEHPVTYYFARALDKSFPYAYEVQRDKFDNILFRNAAKKGVTTLEETKVTRVDFLSDHSSVIEAQNKSGQTLTWRAKFLVDASGRGTFLGNKFKIKKRCKDHNSAAIFGHFSDVERRPGKDEGNISVYWFEHGWFWMIPFKDGSMSVGAVCWPYYLNSRTVEVEQFLWDTINSNPLVAARMNNAKLISPVTATGNFSYRAERMAGDGYIMVGDAFAFVDPVFSSGVLLAMNGAVAASEIVDQILRKPESAPALIKSFNHTVRHGIKTFSWFIYRITQPAMRNMFMAPRNWFHMEEGIQSLLAGDLFRDTPLKRPLLFFKIIYWISYLFNWRENAAARNKRKQSLRGGPLSVKTTDSPEA